MLIKNPLLKEGNNINVAIIAIAKNESAYLAEWIHHHLYFGFSGIFIGINRTTDSSQEVIENIQSLYENIFLYNVDFFDKGTSESQNNQIQSLSYSYLTQCAIEKKKFTHLLYIDIDEFWFHNDFNTRVDSYIGSMCDFDAISFNWLMQYGDESVFAKPFENLTCEPTKQLKSLISVDFSEKIFKYRCHFPWVEKDSGKYIRVDSNGVSFIEGQHEEVSKEIPDLKSKAFILHRAYRSEREYLSLLGRENPNSIIPIKNNRMKGFRENGYATLIIDESKLNKYWVSLENMVSSCGLDKFLEESRFNIIKKSNTILNVDIDIIVKNLTVYSQALKGTYMRSFLLEKIVQSKDVFLRLLSTVNILDLMKNIEVYNEIIDEVNIENDIISKLNKHKKIIEKDENAIIFHKCSIFYESKKKYDIALQYSELALLARPKGEKIKNRRDMLREHVKILENVNLTGHVSDK